MIQVFRWVMAIGLMLTANTIQAQSTNTGCFATSLSNDYYDIIEQAANFAPAGDLSVDMLSMMFGSSYLTLSQGASTSAAGTATQLSASFENARESGFLAGNANATNARDSGILGLGATGIIGALSVVLNAAGLLLTFWILGVVIFTGALNSAHEGVVLGQQYSTLWVPVRTVIAIGSLMPIFGGYSLAQQIIMMVGRVSIGLANIAYAGAMSFIVANGGITPATISEEAQGISNGLIQSAMCMAYADASGYKTSVDYSDAKLLVTDRASGQMKRNHVERYRYVYSASFNVTEPGAVEVEAGACGRVAMLIPGEFPNDDTGNAALARWQSVFDPLWSRLRSAIESPQMAALAKRLAATQSIDPYAQWLPIQDQIDSAIKGAFDAGVLVAAEGADDLVCDMAAEMRQAGWGMLGAIYWNVSNYSRDQESRTREIGTAVKRVGPDTSTLALDMVPPFHEAPFTDASVLKDYASVQNGFDQAALAAKEAIEYSRPRDFHQPSQDLLNTVSSTADGDASDGWPRVIQYVFKDFATDRFIDIVTAEGDVIGNLASMGHKLIIGAEGGLAVILAAKTLTEGKDANLLTKTGWNILGLHPGITVGQVIAKVISGIMGILMLLIIPMLVLGIYFAFYLPAIPIIYWFTSMTSWLIAHIQAVVSAPMWCAAHVAPQGNGFASDQARNGYMTVLSILFRPILMVTGFFAGMLAIQIMGLFIGAIFPIAYRSITMDTLFGLISFLAVSALLLIISITVMQRIFSMAYEIADDILEFFGGGRRQLGDAGSNQQAGSMFMGAFVTGGYGVGGVGSSTLAAGKARRDKLEQQALQDKNAKGRGAAENSGDTA